MQELPRQTNPCQQPYRVYISVEEQEKIAPETEDRKECANVVSTIQM